VRQIFEDFFESQSIKRVLITAHGNADPDALCSAVAVEFLVKILHSEVDCEVSFDGLNVISQKIIQKLDLIIQVPSNFNVDAIIIVDTNSIEQLGCIKHQILKEIPVLVIDHHVFHPNTKEFATHLIINETAVAAAEIIYELYQTFEITVPEKIARLLFLGILSDSRHLVLANNKTLQIVNHLLDSGVNFSEMVELLSIPMDRPERIARLKAAQRATLYKFTNWIIATSHVSAYEASACRALIHLGADVALVFSQNKDEIRVAGRATTQIVKTTGLNLAKDIMEKIGPIMHGEGGGHDRAAGCNGTGNVEKPLKLALKLLEEKLTEDS